MLRRIDFKKKLIFDNELPNYTDLWVVRSEVSPSVAYAVDKTRFAVIRPEGAVFCPVQETLSYADKFVPEIASEIKEIYNHSQGLFRESGEMNRKKTRSDSKQYLSEGLQIHRQVYSDHLLLQLFGDSL